MNLYLDGRSSSFDSLLFFASPGSSSSLFLTLLLDTAFKEVIVSVIIVMNSIEITAVIHKGILSSVINYHSPVISFLIK